MERHRESMRFVAYLLNEMQHWREFVENDRLLFLPVHVDPLFPLRDRRQRLVCDSQTLESIRDARNFGERVIISAEQQRSVLDAIRLFEQLIIQQEEE